MLDEARQTNTSQNLFGQTAAMGGSIAKYHTRTWAYNYQQLLNWHHLFDKHDVEVMLGHETTVHVIIICQHLRTTYSLYSTMSWQVLLTQVL